jgi:hypothetical protein
MAALRPPRKSSSPEFLQHEREVFRTHCRLKFQHVLLADYARSSAAHALRDTGIVHRCGKTDFILELAACAKGARQLFDYLAAAALQGAAHRFIECAYVPSISASFG